MTHTLRVEVICGLQSIQVYRLQVIHLADAFIQSDLLSSAKQMLMNILEDMPSLLPHNTAHTHTWHMQDAMEACSLLFPILESSPRDIQEQWAASDAAPGDQVQVLGPDCESRVRTDEHLLCFACFRLQVIHLADAFIQSDLQVVQTIET